MKVAQFLTLLIATLSIATLAEGTSVESQSEGKGKVLVILGASYAKGWGAPPLPGYTVVNRGVGGEETKDMLARFQQDVVDADPAAVLIWGHVNNITRSAPEKIPAVKEDTKKHYVEMIRMARGAGIQVILATEIPWTEPTGWVNDIMAFIGHLRGKTSYAQRVTSHVHELNDFLRQIAARDRLQLLDFETVFAREDGTRINEYAAEDGSHISAAGYRALTEYTVKELGRRP